ncbi:formate dehydrogenase accessory sulfurtransferase FdhD [Wansuia hejianensis]|uniref:Formate dehydrogenase accessory sulfurtransferase FdhD n=1 Tax=Wansuia hejianensis TaxID=2763667 RepID=A0A926IMU9_9FIRM|nr:formate dehydrogenase accessory sulfurtransferase FdhD [Wansuia hejianensis]MBC8591001.1 formate dehydrogenase accessory sulfurtransferase FdhD [Wansuia hejianensis]
MIQPELHSAVEMPVELWVNNKIITTFMCTPSDLEELAIGHLLTRGMIKDISHIDDININLNTYQIFVTTNKPISTKLYSVPEFVLSGTSSVDKFSNNIYKIPKIENDFAVELSKIVKIANTMEKEAIIYNTTGGVHGAIVADTEKNIHFVREDIGRHCAVDKAIGISLKKGLDLSNTFICTTGRISLDMLLKCAVVQIPIVASLKYPSDMGINLANYYGISIVSRILSENPLIYTNEQRIIK